MENSIIFDLIDTKLIHEWREEAKKDDKCGFKQRLDEIESELSAGLDEKNKELLSLFSLAFKNRLDYIYYNINIKMLNFGIKTGMELQRAFNDFEND